MNKLVMFALTTCLMSSFTWATEKGTEENSVITPSLNQLSEAAASEVPTMSATANPIQSLELVPSEAVDTSSTVDHSSSSNPWYSRFFSCLSAQRTDSSQPIMTTLINKYGADIKEPIDQLKSIYKAQDMNRLLPSILKYGPELLNILSVCEPIAVKKALSFFEKDSTASSGSLRKKQFSYNTIQAILVDYEPAAQAIILEYGPKAVKLIKAYGPEVVQLVEELISNQSKI